MEGERRWRALERAAWIPPLIVAVLVWLAGSDVPYWDDWELNSVLASTREGSLSAGDLFALHNGHPMALTRTILAGVALATGWNVRAQLLVNVGVVIAALFMVLLLASKHPAGSRRAIAFVGSGLALFSLSQYENWLWAWQLMFFLTVTLIAAAVAALSATRWRMRWRIAAAGVLCLLASFSSGFGLTGWIALAPLVATKVSSRHGSARAAIATLVWLAAGAAVTAASLAPGGATDHFLPLQTHNVLLFFLTVAGTPWTSLPLAAALLGALTIALFVVLAWTAARIDREGAMPWISLGLVALGFAGIATIARAPLGWEGAGSMRYATPAILLIVAAINLAAGWLPQPRASRVAGTVAVLSLFASVTFVFPFWSFAAARHESRVCTDLLFLMKGASPACLGYQDPRFRAWATFARDHRLRSFADDSWFDERGDAPRSRGSLPPGPFRAPLLVTRGPAHEPLTLTWSEDEPWSSALPANDASSKEALDLWTIPLHERRFVPVVRGAAPASVRP